MNMFFIPFLWKPEINIKIEIKTKFIILWILWIQ